MSRFPKVEVEIEVCEQVLTSEPRRRLLANQRVLKAPRRCPPIVNLRYACGRVSDTWQREKSLQRRDNQAIQRVIAWQDELWVRIST